MKEIRTYGWYATHYISHIDGTPSDKTVGGDPINAPSWRTNLKNLEALGVKDVVPNPENFERLRLMTIEWNKQPYDTRPEPLTAQAETAHWILNDILKDPTLDTAMFRAFVSWRPITIIENPGCPEDVIRSLIETSGTESDSSKKTKGGEMGIFALYNRALSPALVDLCVRKAKKASTQKRAMEHQNISRASLVYLVNSGKTDAVKREALLLMFQKGWLTVE